MRPNGDPWGCVRQVRRENERGGRLRFVKTAFDGASHCPDPGRGVTNSASRENANLRDTSSAMFTWQV